MKILIDGIAYSLKKTGGVRRYFDGLLPELKKIDKNLKIKLKKTIFEPRLSPINEKISQWQWKNISGDIFHTTYYTRHPNKNIPQVVTTYDLIYEKFPQYFSGPRNAFFKKQKKKAIKLADAIICISQNTKKDLLKHFKVDKDKIHVIYPGIDPVFKKINSKKIKQTLLQTHKLKKPYLLFVGPRGRYKNFKNLLKAYSLWEGNLKFDLLVVGGDKFTQQEKTLIKNLNLVKKVHNSGFVSDKDLPSFYRCAYAFIFPSLYEGFGFPLLEAMSCGTLCLASNKASFPEIGKDSILYFNPQDTNDILKTLDDSLNKKRRNALIKKSFKRAQDFSFKKAAKQTLKVYQRLFYKA